MQLKWKIFKKSFPTVCTKCGALSNMPREYCEICGIKDSFRDITKEDWEKHKMEEKVSEV